MKKLAAIALGILLTTSAHADFIAPGFFASGFIEDGFFEESAPQVLVPDVTPDDLTEADVALEAASLDTGEVALVCSLEAANEVISQNPIAGAMVDAGSTVNLVASNGTDPADCPHGYRRIGIKIGIGL